MISNYSGRTVPVKKINKLNNITCTFNNDTESYCILGGASSQILGGKLLGNILEKSYKMFSCAITNLNNDDFIEPLNLHTSIGVSSHIEKFINVLKKHVPYNFDDDLTVSIQIEGASAVHAAVDMILSKQNIKKQHIGVGSSCYHGPIPTSFGKFKSSYIDFKQIFYPVTILKHKRINETIEQFYDRIEDELNEFITLNKEILGVIIIEPQWGSAGTGQVWPVDILKRFINNAHKEGIFVISDEIMCGIGRHGKNNMFLCDANNLDVDAVTFGKSIGGGIFPLSGAIINNLHNKNLNIFPKQSHTYSHGANIIGIITATELLLNLPDYYKLITERELIIKESINNLDNKNIIACGQGLLWGFYIKYENINTKRCELEKYITNLKIIVYFIPDGILISPIYNCNTKLLKESFYNLINLFNSIS